jgi:hypothetical protein
VCRGKNHDGANAAKRPKAGSSPASFGEQCGEPGVLVSASVRTHVR